MKERDGYELIDSGSGCKLERFGSYTLSRPCSQAVWKKSLPESVWLKADATFSRIDDKRWKKIGDLPEGWDIETEGITFHISPTDFGHLGIFAEQKAFWRLIKESISTAKHPVRLLNLFAYSGGATLAAAQAGAEVCHLDASKGMVSWARDNAKRNGLENAPIRWIVEDVQKFIEREVRRQCLYDAIILDPPTFGRGAQGELFKIESHIIPLLSSCRKLLNEKPLFILFSCHTPGFTPTVLEHLLKQTFGDLKSTIQTGEMLLGENSPYPIPSGSYAYLTFKS